MSVPEQGGRGCRRRGIVRGGRLALVRPALVAPWLLAFLAPLACGGPRAGVDAPGGRLLGVDAADAGSPPPRDGRPAPPRTPSPPPAPPDQGESWSGPGGSSAVARLGRAADLLFRQGMADPRGCEYREVTIWVGSVWNDGAAVETHGWVIPADGGASAPRWVVAWNGAVYPILDVGAPVELAADVRASAASDEDAGGRPPRLASSEAEVTAATGLSHLRVAMLLRLGETALAEQMWAAVREREAPIGYEEDEDPFPWLAGSWAWAIFDRALGAHMRGDDLLARHDLELLDRVREPLEAEARRRGGGAAGEPLLGFLEPLPALLADQTRRAGEAHGGRHDQAALAEMSPARRIAALVEDLDEVAARQMGQPGGIDLASDPVVAALIAEGEAAVEPLIEVLETDTRLTRSVHFWRDFDTARSVIGVHEAAYVALANILDESFFAIFATGDDLTSRGEAGRRRVATRVRAFWERIRGVPLEERWYRALRDDALGPEGWVQAAAHIVRPAGTIRRRGSMFGTGWVRGPEPGGDAATGLSGAALRERRAPSVTELFSRRIDDLIALGPRRRGAACEVAAALVVWDRGASLPALQRLGAACPAAGEGCPCFIELTIARATLGDRAALDGYDRWLRSVQPGRGGDDAALLAPLWMFPDDPRMVALAEHLFDREASPWAAPTIDHDGGLVGLAATRLVEVPAYRALLLRRLADREPAATLIVRGEGRYQVRWSRGVFGRSPRDPVDMPPAGTERSLRVADLVAIGLSQHRGAPAFAPWWDRARRDAALAAMVRWVRSLGR